MKTIKALTLILVVLGAPAHGMQERSTQSPH